METKSASLVFYTLSHEKHRAVFPITGKAHLADSKEKPPNSAADDSYGHVVHGIVFLPGVISSFAQGLGGTLSPARKEKI